MLRDTNTNEYTDEELATLDFSLQEQKELFNEITDPDARECLAANPYLAEEIQEKFLTCRHNANEKNYQLEGLAGNPNLSRKIMEKLVFNTDSEIRYCLAGNPKLPADLQKTLINASEASKPAIMYALVQNPAISKEMQWEAYNSSAWEEILENLACNKNLLPKIAKKLAQKGNKSITRHLKRNPGVTSFKNYPVKFFLLETKIAEIDHKFENQVEKACSVYTPLQKALFANIGKDFTGTFLEMQTHLENLEKLLDLNTAEEELFLAFLKNTDITFDIKETANCVKNIMKTIK